MIRRILPAVVLPVLLTAVTLAGVAWNRSGGRAPIVLSDRELPLRHVSDDNSGRSVWIRHQYTYTRNEPWLTFEKFTALGFDTSVDPASPDADAHYRRALGRVVYVALEFDGPAWRALMAEYERSIRESNPEADIKKEREASSRLVPIDAELDAATLEARYPDPRTHLITRGVIRVFSPARAGGRMRLSGAVELTPDTLYVPPAIAARLGSTPYRVSVRYGRRYEPWIVGVEP